MDHLRVARIITQRRRRVLRSCIRPCRAATPPQAPDGIRGSATGQMDELLAARIVFIGLCRTRSDRFAITSYPRKPAPVSWSAPCLLCRLNGNLSIAPFPGNHCPMCPGRFVGNRDRRNVHGSPREQLLQPRPWCYILAEARSDDSAVHVDSDHRPC
jgi:hypothetical protein